MSRYPSPNKEYDPVTHYDLASFKKPSEDKQELQKMVMKLLKAPTAEKTVGLIVDKLRDVDYDFDTHNYSSRMANGKNEKHINEAALAAKLGEHKLDATYSPEEIMMLASLIQDMGHVGRQHRRELGSRELAHANAKQSRKDFVAESAKKAQIADADDQWSKL